MATDIVARNLERNYAKVITVLDGINAKLVPKVTSMAVNKSGKRAVSKAIRVTAKEVKVPAKIIRERVKVVNAKPQNPIMFARIRRYDIPAIAIGTAVSQIKTRKGVMQVEGAKRASSGRYAKRSVSGQTSIRVGRHRFPNAFVQQLKNGKTHIMHRTSESRYPIDVVKVPILNPITKAMEREARYALNHDMPVEFKRAAELQLSRLISK